MVRSKRRVNREKMTHGFFMKPQGVPRGFLRQYLLRRIAEKPTHGYDLLQEIETKTGGSWRPGAGSIYPILKELVAEGCIRAESPKKGERPHRVYRITADGNKLLQQSSEMMMKAGQNWGAMRRVFIELIDPPHVPTIFTNMATGQFEFAREILESKGDKISPRELQFMLKEYALNLDRQLKWANRMLKQ